MPDVISAVAPNSLLDFTLLAFAFLFGIALFLMGYSLLAPSLDVRRRAVAAQMPGAVTKRAPQDLSGGKADTLREAIETYYESLKDEQENSLKRRLVKAGYFSPRAPAIYYALRVTGTFVAFVGLTSGLPLLFPSLGITAILFIAGCGAALALILPNFFMDALGRRQEEWYRRSFPDFMDLMVLCADAGLSLEAAVARVTKEFDATHPDLAVHLNIMLLEIRAGKRLRDALRGFADRLDLDEARDLATLFRQSEEVGASLTQTLRVFSREMKQNRIVRAEEKANSLSVKMLLPLGLFMFPVVLIVVLLPVFLSLMSLLEQNSPG